MYCFKSVFHAAKFKMPFKSREYQYNIVTNCYTNNEIEHIYEHRSGKTGLNSQANQGRLLPRLIRDNLFHLDFFLRRDCL